MGSNCYPISLIKRFELLRYEVAADVVQKKEPNEASTIFIEGSRPLEVAVPVTTDVERHVEDENQLQKAVDQCEETARNIIELPSQCSCTTTNVESPDQEKLKEPLSAPF
ncbi:hypothetical protein FH972_003662 [Carpinus fangiana]|uniref:Uncharacterized protein n=1 Tax=Carpinus fangiana TaxID=176857 RepID=A0A5N6QJ79_9ROSI|nr:hypothetical protein FH972_003662 [Carpinus fangiana]